MKCKHCGEEISNDSNFCEFCGTRLIDTYNEALLNVLDCANADRKPMAAYKARNKCYELCEKEHPNDYKEYVKKIMLERYPKMDEKCKIDIKYLTRNLFFLIVFLVCFCIAYSVHWETFNVICYEMGVEPYYPALVYRECASWEPYPMSYEYSLFFGISTVIGFYSLMSLLFRKRWYTRKFEKMIVK